jgi:hypothetical protein
MLFLMNDVVLDLEDAEMSPAHAAHRYRRLDLEFVSDLGRELYAEQPLLQWTAPERAMRLAVMIRAKAPHINGALFIAPAEGCPLDEVSVRYTQISPPMMQALAGRQEAGALNNLVADREVWKRLAA